MSEAKAESLSSDSSKCKAKKYAECSSDGSQSVESLSNEEESERKLIGSFSTVMNLLNSLLGAGMLSIPSSFNAVGSVPSSILVLIFAVLNYITTTMILRLQFKAGVTGYDELVYHYLGRVGHVIFSICLLIFITLGALSHIIIAGDLIVSWFGIAHIDLSTFGNRALMILIYMLILPIALSIPKHLTFLSRFTNVTILFFLAYVAVIVYKMVAYLQHDTINPTCKVATVSVDIFSALSIYATTFSLPCCAIPIFNEYDPNMKKRNYVTIVATILFFLIILIPSVCAYLEFGETANGNILNSFPDDDIAMIVVRAGFFLIVTCSYPILQLTITSSWSTALFKESEACNLYGWRRALILVIGNIIPLLIGMFLAQVKPALAVAGAFGGCIADFAFPGLLWWKASEKRWYSISNILCMVLFFFGVAIACIATYYSVLDAIAAFKDVKF